MIERADERRRGTGQPTIFFLDEIHRFNKAQQDALLPAVEEGLVTLIGATTENPYFEVNSALLSRSADLRAARRSSAEHIARAAAPRPRRSRARDRRPARRSPTRRSSCSPTRSGGDARVALAALERAVETARGRRRGEIDLDDRRGRAAAQGACATTARATATTTTSRPGSRRRAAPTPTPPSTTWR